MVVQRLYEQGFERGLLKPLEKVGPREGEEVRIAILSEEFPELVEKISIEAREDVGRGGTR